MIEGMSMCHSHLFMFVYLKRRLAIATFYAVTLTLEECVRQFRFCIKCQGPNLIMKSVVDFQIIQLRFLINLGRFIFDTGPSMMTYLLPRTYYQHCSAQSIYWYFKSSCFSDYKNLEAWKFSSPLQQAALKNWGYCYAISCHSLFSYLSSNFFY